MSHLFNYYCRQGLSLREASRKFDIPYTTLQNKLSGKTPFATKMGPNTILTEAEEKVLSKFVIDSQRRAIPMTKESLLDTVETIIEKEAAEGLERKRPANCSRSRPGKEWYRLFLRRHPEISIRTAESLSMARKSVSKTSVMQWFADVKQYLADVNAEDILLDPSRNFNIDESGFSLSPPQRKVLAETGSKTVSCTTSSKSKENVTVLGRLKVLS